MKKLKLLLSASALAALAGFIAAPATAADLGVPPVYRAPVPVWSWTGFYVGLNTGGGIGSNSTTDTAVFTGGTGVPGSVPFGTNVMFNESFAHRPTGWIFGGQIGYNWQASSFVFGVEADWQWTSQKDTATVGGCFPAASTLFSTGSGAVPVEGQCLTDEQKLTNFGTARARAGYVVNDTLWYVTGGAAWATVKESYAFNQSANPLIISLVGPNASLLPGAASFSHSKSGWTLGGGVEQRIWGGWSAKLEYLYVDLGTVTDTFGVAPNPAFLLFGPTFVGALGVTSSSRVRDHIVRVGLNYKMY